MAGEHLHVFLVEQVGHTVGGGGQVEKPTGFGLFNPALIVAVAVKEDALVLANDVPENVVDFRHPILGLFQAVGVLAQGLRHSGVEHHVGAGDGVGGAQHAELKLVAGEGEGGGAVAVSGVPGQRGQGVDPQLHALGLGGGVLAALLHGLENAGQLIPQEDGHHGGGRFMGAQAVVVASGGHRQPQQILVVVHRLDDGTQEEEEPGVLVGLGAGGEEVHSGVGGHGPVVVLARAIDSGKGLFVEQTHQTVLGGHLLHDLHGQLVVVGGDVGGGVDGGQLVLRGSHLVVLGLGQNAQLPQLLVELLHVGGHPLLDVAEIVVVELLPLGGAGAEEGAPGVDEVGPLVVQLPVHQEILLFRAHRGAHRLHIGVPQQMEHPQGLAVQGLHGAQQGGLLVQCLAAVGAEGGGNAQRLALDEGVRGGVPGGVAPGLKGGSQPAGREGGGVGLPSDELLAGKLHNHPTIRGGGDEAVVLLGGDAGHGLEPVGEVGSPLLHRPVPHGGGHHIGHGQVQGRSLLHGTAQGTVNILRKAGLHHTLVKYLTSKIAGHVRHVHPSSPENKNGQRRHRTELHDVVVRWMGL